MKIAIMGPAGSGKSTFTKILTNRGKYVVNVDEVINILYSEKDTISFLQENGFIEAINEDKVDKDKIINIITLDPECRILLEDFFFSEILRIFFTYKEDIYFDGILPRFSKYFDQVIYIEMPIEQRRNNLLEERCQKIE